MCCVLLSLLLLVVRGCKTGTKRRVTFQNDLEEESEVVEIDTDNYGATGIKVSEIYEIARTNQKSGMRKGFEKFPFLKHFGSEEQNLC